MLIVLVALIAIIAVFNIIGLIISGPKYTGPVTDHFDGKKFINPTGIQAKGLREVLKWATNRKRGRWNKIENLTYGAKPAARVDRGIKITFVNHSTFLIQTNGLNILTDPVWSERASPFSFLGPKRKRKPGIKFEDLPVIDLILLSHNHYDHLDLDTVKKIYQEYRPKIITPLGVKKFLDQKRVYVTGDLDWWDEYQLNNDIKIQAVPAQHFSGRGTFDRDATLWCGYVIKRKERNIYFVGDTGYNDKTFKEIGERCAPIEIALIPIGAYKPQWFMSPIHCSPEEAIKIHIELKSKQSIATHFGTFALADEGREEPVNDLKEALQGNNIPQEKFIALKEGEGKFLVNKP
jgi:L-ascorbate metabolism protein UlaG (beta-lactamase superfamily)